jgi:alpha-L-fucosidase 2
MPPWPKSAWWNKKKALQTNAFYYPPVITNFFCTRSYLLQTNPPTPMTMRHFPAVLLLLSLTACASATRTPAKPGEPVSELKLQYDCEASDWMTQALPIGNGQMGAMIFGGTESERIQFNEESLWIGNEDDTGAYQDFGEVTVKFEDTEATFSNPSNHASPRGQTVEAGCDGNPGTKWCVEHGGRFPIVWQMAMPKTQLQPITAYTLTSAEDVPDRDPKAWRFLGSQDGTAWTLLDEQRDVPVWSARLTPKTFSFTNKTAYAHYRLEFLETHGATHFQIAEIALSPVNVSKHSGVKDYRRELDLNRAVHRVTYEKNGVKFTREAFASFPAKVIVVRFTADKPGSISGEIGMTDAHAKEYSLVYGGKPVPATSADHHTEISVNPPAITIGGVFPGYKYDGGKEWLPLNREAQLRVLHEGGAVSAKDGRLQITNADSVTLLLAAGTDFRQDRSKNWRGPLPHAAVSARLDAAAKTPYTDLLAEHVRDYQNLFDRVTLSLGGTPAVTLPTDLRLKQYTFEKPDLGLEELMFQYGRYLLISSSRAGGLPANLQGKWNHSNQPPWRSDYHTDVNLEMNYWLADVANLGECFQPFADWIQSIRAVRLEATKKAFGTRGWILRGESGLFGGSTWDWTPGTSAWFMQNSFDHYAFTGDQEYLRTLAYPAMKEVCEFWIDRLKELPDGTLVTPQGLSPEHGPVEDGVSFDQQLVWDLFNNTIEAADALATDRDFRDLLAAKQAKLLAPKIGKWGQLQEWMVDRDDPNDHHRHTSHLIAVYPGRQITVAKTPGLAKAAAVSLAARGVTGDSHREWAFAWRMSIWARLGNGDKAHFMYENLLKYGVLPNLFCTHPPFQMDGNFGCVAGVCEMLVQSQAGEIELLPALPAAWPTGSVKGLRARGGFTVDIAWQDGKVTNYRIASAKPCVVKIRVNGETKTITSARL